LPSIAERLAAIVGRRGGCISVAEAAAALRATPSEVLEAAKAMGVGVDGAGRLCIGPAAGHRRRRRQRVKTLRYGDCCVVAVAPPRSGLPGLVEAARLAARSAQRLRARLCGSRRCRLVVPVVVAAGKRRLVEGVLVAADPRGACRRGMPAAARSYSCLA